MRIRDKLLLMLAVPTLVLAAFSGRYLYSEWCAYQQTVELTAAVNVIKAVAAVTHALQAERGASVGYVSSAGKSRESMESARGKTDGAQITLPEVTSLAPLMQPAYAAWRATLGQLNEQRQMIDRLSNTPKMVFDGYTARIDGGMGVGAFIAAGVQDIDLKSGMSALLALQCAKENMGRQRARIMGVVSSGAMSAAEGQLIAKLIGQEEACSQQFKALNRLNLSLSMQLSQNPAVAEVDQLRQQVLTGSFSSMEPSIWFTAASAKINVVRDSESALIDRLVELNANKRTAASLHIVWILFLMAAVLLVGGGMCWKTSASLLHSILSVQHAMLRIANERDLTVEIPVSGDQEMAEIARAFNRLANSLRETLSQVIVHSVSVEKSATELAEASAEEAISGTTQSEATASSAAAVEEMSTSLSAVFDLISDVGEMATGANAQASSKKQIVLAAADTMRNLAAEVRNTAQIMRELETRSSAISSVVQGIKEIADQTNLLALNAAIEAARAGESGRGFAVVADEVRKLAERTSKSTHEIAEVMGEMRAGTNAATQQMQHSETQVENGAQQVQETVATLDGLANEIAKISEHMADVLNASREQSSASQQLARNVEQIALMIDRNSLVTEQTAAAAHDLKDMAAALRSAASCFKTV